MNIYIHYKITNQPWGGINSFFKSFIEYLVNCPNVTIVDSIDEKCDIFLMGAASLGQRKLIDLQMVKHFLNKRDSINGSKKKLRFKLIHRLDGLRSIYNNLYDPTDDLQIKLSKLADSIIFQSNFSLENFKSFGYKKNNYTIIYNGVNQKIFNFQGKRFYKNGRLKVLSVNWSSNIRKGYKTIADFSENAQIESCFVGNWNSKINKKNVKVISPLPQKELVKFYRDADVFLHAAENDPCPNVVLEAMSCGLPVIYHDSGGTREIASNYGVPLPNGITKERIESIINKIKTDYSFYLTNLIRDKENFSIITTAEKYLSFFRKVDMLG